MCSTTRTRTRRRSDGSLGLISEEYDVERRRPVGNFPQAFTHLALVHGAGQLDRANLSMNADRLAA